MDIILTERYAKACENYNKAVSEYSTENHAQIDHFNNEKRKYKRSTKQMIGIFASFALLLSTNILLNSLFSAGFLTINAALIILGIPMSIVAAVQLYRKKGFDKEKLEHERFIEQNINLNKKTLILKTEVAKSILEVIVLTENKKELDEYKSSHSEQEYNEYLLQLENQLTTRFHKKDKITSDDIITYFDDWSQTINPEYYGKINRVNRKKVAEVKSERNNKTRKKYYSNNEDLYHL